MTERRLNKFLSQAGVCSRRKADSLLKKGLVTVNGKRIEEPGFKVNKEDEVRVEGELIETEKKIYILLNKPEGYICTLEDPRDRPIVTDLVDVPQRIYPAGRLDRDTSGLLILTNDGDFANLITSPEYGCPKCYKVTVRGKPDPSSIDVLREGIVLDGVKTREAEIVRVDGSGEKSVFDVTLREGKNNQIKRMFKAVGHPVISLKRYSISGIGDNSLSPGDYRHLRGEEIEMIHNEFIK